MEKMGRAWPALRWSSGCRNGLGTTADTSYGPAPALARASPTACWRSARPRRAASSHRSVKKSAAFRAAAARTEACHSGYAPSPAFRPRTTCGAEFGVSKPVHRRPELRRIHRWGGKVAAGEHVVVQVPVEREPPSRPTVVAAVDGGQGRHGGPDEGEVEATRPEQGGQQPGPHLRHLPPRGPDQVDRDVGGTGRGTALLAAEERRERPVQVQRRGGLSQPGRGLQRPPRVDRCPPFPLRPERARALVAAPRLAGRRAGQEPLPALALGAEWPAAVDPEGLEERAHPSALLHRRVRGGGPRGPRLRRHSTEGLLLGRGERERQLGPQGGLPRHLEPHPGALGPVVAAGLRGVPRPVLLVAVEQCPTPLASHRLTSPARRPAAHLALVPPRRHRRHRHLPLTVRRGGARGDHGLDPRRPSGPSAAAMAWRPPLRPEFGPADRTGGSGH